MLWCLERWPNLAYAIIVVSRFMVDQGKVHGNALKWIMSYLKSTLKIGLSYGGDECTNNGLVGYVDFDYGGNIDTRRKSLSGYVFPVYVGAVNWKSRIFYGL